METFDNNYELFRRAVVERDADAWAAVAARYRNLLITWAARSPASQATQKRSEDLADQALVRAWIALTPERFAMFPSTSALLAYLRACVTTTVIDAARDENDKGRYPDDMKPPNLHIKQIARDSALKKAAAAAFEGLLEQNHQSAQEIDDASRQERRLCGRWLVLHRMRLGLTNKDMIERTGIDEQTLLLLESGTANETLLTPIAQERLCAALISEQHNVTKIMEVVKIALGRPAEDHDHTMEWVRAGVTAPAMDATRAQVTYNREELWQLVEQLVTSEAERVVLHERFIYNLPPRAIQARHPTLFSDVSVVYTSLRKLTERLRRNQDLRRLYPDLFEA
jgi:DNA-directed RNA polymerase specialized sigma24 family protein